VNNITARYRQYSNPSISAGAARVMKSPIAALPNAETCRSRKKRFGSAPPLIAPNADHRKQKTGRKIALPARFDFLARRRCRAGGLSRSREQLRCPHVAPA
jgi:hypothetical protein